MLPPPSAEVTILALLGLLQLLQLVLYSVLANMQVGTAYALSPRDEPRRLTGAAARVQRLCANGFEALILYGAAMAAVVLAGKSSPVTEICAHVFWISRLLYLPAYVGGWVPWRSVIWGVGFGALAVMFAAALL